MSSHPLSPDDERGLYSNIPPYPLKETDQRVSVVVGEDDPELRELVSDRLRREGWDVTAVGDGQELYDELMATDPDLVITDERMPGLSGLEVLEKLRGSRWTTPFILMTGLHDKWTHLHARGLGASQVFDKPLNLPSLVAAARALVAPSS